MGFREGFACLIGKKSMVAYASDINTVSLRIPVNHSNKQAGSVLWELVLLCLLPWRGVCRWEAVSVMNGRPVEYLSAASAAVLAFPQIFLG